MSKKVSDFKALKLKLASPEEILSWSHGEVTKPETINYRTQKPEKDGLFCERIFGPTKDWECYCGKYKRIRYKGIVCDKCGVEVTKSSVRRERMGHIKLATPVCHIWFLRGIPSKIGLILDKSVQELEKVIYFGAYIITKIDEEARQKALEEIDKEYRTKLKSLRKEKISEKEKKAKRNHLKEIKDAAKNTLNNLKALEVISEIEYHQLSLKYGQVFEAGTGAESIRKILENINLEDLKKELEERIKHQRSLSLNKKKLWKRLKFVEAMIKAKIRPEWMILTVLPVLPPDLRPMVHLDGDRYATSDLNDLYRRVINRNNRLKKLIELNAPEVICRNEKRMLQEAVDALIDNSARHGQTAIATTGQRRQLKSLADMLKGKQGRFRQNLLGKRVDYSGRSVIVIGPELKLHQCGLPKKMALEIFKPFVICKLIEKELAHNIRNAGRLIESETDEVWEALEEVIQNRYVLLNRAPTLHRLGIQAFQPLLTEGKAIQIHPMVCRAFNADFDGDQMAVHLPLSNDAQKESKQIMLSSKNLLKPATGEPIAIPTQDIILGAYWMTGIEEGLKGEGKFFQSPEEAILALQFNVIELRSKIKLKIDNQFIDTSAGRIIFNQILPKEIAFVNKQLNRKTLRKLVSEIIEKCGLEKAGKVLDQIKKLGFEYATYSGISLGMCDFNVPREKKKLINMAEKEIETIHKQYREGLLSREERRIKIIEIWTRLIEKVASLIPKSLDKNGPIKVIMDSGARGNWSQTNQMNGMKGLVVNPAGEIIELPVKSSFKEGFNVLEYFISTHGARKGTADTALRTSTAGYLTRRLVDVCQDIVVKEENCGDTKGIVIYREDGEELNQGLSSRIIGRFLLENIKDKKGKIIIKKDTLIDKEIAAKIDEMNIDKVRVRSVVNCKTPFGVCQKCYGYDLGSNELVKLGEAVGIVTAQSIGEPGTQLTMRTFHTGGIAGKGDITQGLPRVEEIFECRMPKGKAVVSETDGQVISIETKKNQKIIKIKSSLKRNHKEKKANLIKKYIVHPKATVLVEKGDLVTQGQQLTDGHIDLKELFRLAGAETVQRYIIKEVRTIYSSQGESIDDKYIEMIIRQMFSRLRIKDPGDSDFLIGEIVEKGRFNLVNEELKQKGKRTAKAQQLILGISKVALTTESFLSAASFQETARVLIDAAIQGKIDPLRGLKENVVIGKLIPAGTGFRK